MPDNDFGRRMLSESEIAVLSTPAKRLISVQFF